MELSYEAEEKLSRAASMRRPLSRLLPSAVVSFGIGEQMAQIIEPDIKKTIDRENLNRQYRALLEKLSKQNWQKGGNILHPMTVRSRDGEQLGILHFSTGETGEISVHQVRS